jgi:Flp pilus assembly protein TadG
VELALLAMLLLLLAFAVFDFGRGFHAALRVSHAARDGARVGWTPQRRMPTS